MIRKQKDVIKRVLFGIKNGWKISNDKKSKKLLAFRGNKEIEIYIVDNKYWFIAKVQHIEFWVGGKLFIFFANIVPSSIHKTFKNIKRAFLFTMGFVHKPTAHQMAKIAFDSLTIGCCYDKIHFKSPMKKTNVVSYFTMKRKHSNYNLSLIVTFFMWPEPYFEMFFNEPFQKIQTFHEKSEVNVVDTCINEVSGQVFIRPKDR